MIRKLKTKPPVATVRCAIYTRKSTEEGLDQDFNSLDAQRESGEAFIASQKAEGWQCLPDAYDDGGFTGGNMERPALKRLLADIEAGKVDCVVVYKVDRLSRSLLDFARIMEVFEQQKVSFVSVTQQFNTATSMGRLVLNVLLSFAQFEREIIGGTHPGQDRRQPPQGQMDGRHADPGLRRGSIRPQSQAGGQRRRGRPRPRDLRPVPEARIAAARRRGVGRAGLAQQGVEDQGGRADGRPPVRQVQSVRPAHQPAVRRQGPAQGPTSTPASTRRSWTPTSSSRCRPCSTATAARAGSKSGNRYGALLKRLLYCKACGKAMVHHFTGSNGKRYRYYTCVQAIKSGRKTCPAKSLPAAEIERVVLDRIRCIAHDPKLRADVVRQARSLADADLTNCRKNAGAWSGT